VKAAFPKHRIHEVKEPLFANVRGFQLAGQNYAMTSLATPATFGSRRRGWCMSAPQERGALRPIRLVFELSREENPSPVR
jgi:hypothetical protein